MVRDQELFGLEETKKSLTDAQKQYIAQRLLFREIIKYKMIDEDMYDEDDSWLNS